MDRRRLRQAAGAALALVGRQGDVTVVVMDDRQIRRLHREWLGVDSATDVLSFPLAGGPAVDRLLGEVYVSAQTARREARARGRSVVQELALYVVHGVLHLVGFDDGEPAALARMREAETRALGALGYPGR
ncbi:MAG: rRNA maturation RNase YbeY [Planctomycetes bacterium]|nr:rRNA maturation RNase YbeY [Planctomycetota bacterium]